MKKHLLIILILLFSLSGCTASRETENEKPIIAVSIVPQATFAEKVCGDNFKIVTMIPSGASAETYEPTPYQMAEFENADIYFSIGVPSEENSILPFVSSKTRVVGLHTKAEEYYSPLMIDGTRDPHLWLSPKRVIVMVEAIAEELSNIDPENREQYQENSEKYINELNALDKEIKEKLKNSENRSFIAFHPAFGYFADDYSLNMYALEEHGKEADAKRISQMAELAKKENIKTVFYQAEASGRQAKSFAEEIGGQAVKLEPLSGDYIPNIRKMADAIKKAMN